VPLVPVILNPLGAVALQLEAFVLLQVTVLLCPLVMLAGLAVRLAVGEAGGGGGGGVVVPLLFTGP